MTRSLNSGSTVQKFPGVVVIGACVSLFAWGLGLRRVRFIWLACSGEHGGVVVYGGVVLVGRVVLNGGGV